MVALWQALCLIVGTTHKSKLSDRKKGLTSATDSVRSEVAVLTEKTKDYLPPADTADLVPPSVTEDTTRHHNKISRN